MIVEKFEIDNLQFDCSYLQWIGTSFFHDQNSFIKHAKKNGFMKRLPNRNVARTLANKKSVVFLVHDNGRSKTCLSCSELNTCPNCYGNVDTQPGIVCNTCKGFGSVEIGTGGYAVVDGIKWKYLKYIKLKRHKNHPFWNEEHEVIVEVCKDCGGRGVIPMGSVFGAYIPSSVIKVGHEDLDEVQTKRELNEAIKCNITFVPFRNHEIDLDWKKIKPGYYAKVDVQNEQKNVSVLGYNAKKSGDFIIFDESVAYNGKQFRGIKKWKLVACSV